MTYKCEQTRKKHFAKLTLAVCFTALLIFVTGAETYGQVYSIERSVIAGGSGRSSSGTLTLEGTVGQPAAGTESTNVTLKLYSGFWQYDRTYVTVTGRVLTIEGRGIRNAVVRLNGPNGEVITSTGQYGRYTFNSVRSDLTYTITVTSRRFQITDSPRTIFIGDNLGNVDFVGVP